MERRSIILIVIVILVIVLGCLSAYVLTTNNPKLPQINLNTTNDNNNTTDVIEVNDTVDANVTVVGDNSTNNLTGNNTTDHKVYNPQSDSYVSVIGEKYDDEVDRWYTYDADGVRYYNTRIN